MRVSRTLAFLFAVLVMPAVALRAQLNSPQEDIRAMMNKSVDDWNRGDIDAFATSYKNSPDILFMGQHIRRGYAQMLAGYKAAFPDQAHMGTLSFTHLEVQMLDERFATMTGWFHLERTAAGGGNADGYFLLVVENTPQGWKIIRDDTTDAKPPTK